MKNALILAVAMALVVGSTVFAGATVRIGGTTAGIGVEYQSGNIAVSSGLDSIETYDKLTGEVLYKETTLGVGVRYIVPTGRSIQPYAGGSVDLFGNYVKAEAGIQFTVWEHLSIRPGINMLYFPADSVRLGNTQLLPGVGMSLQF